MPPLPSFRCLLMFYVLLVLDQSIPNLEAMSSQTLTQVLLLLNVFVVSITCWSVLNALNNGATQVQFQEHESFAPPTMEIDTMPTDTNSEPPAAKEDHEHIAVSSLMDFTLFNPKRVSAIFMKLERRWVRIRLPLSPASPAV